MSQMLFFFDQRTKKQKCDQGGSGPLRNKITVIHSAACTKKCVSPISTVCAELNPFVASLMYVILIFCLPHYSGARHIPVGQFAKKTSK